MDLNIYAPFFLTQQLLPELRAAGIQVEGFFEESC